MKWKNVFLICFFSILQTHSLVKYMIDSVKILYAFFLCIPHWLASFAMKYKTHKSKNRIMAKTVLHTSGSSPVILVAIN